jgi:hypothetical protein
MTPMIPKINVKPEATKNSNKPYCSAFRHWIKKMDKSMKNLWAETRPTDRQKAVGGQARWTDG